MLFRALRWRADASLALLVVALAAAIAAAAGPIYLEAAGASALRAALLGQPVWQTGLTVSQPTSAPVPMSVFEAAEGVAPTGAGGAQLFGSPIVTHVQGVGVGRFVATVVSRTGACAHLAFVSGSCPAGDGVVAISERSAASMHVAVGAKVAIGIDEVQGRKPATVTVGGIYRTPDVNAPYWWGDDFFPFGAGAVKAPSLDDLFAAPASFGPGTELPRADTVLQLPLDVSAAQRTGPAGVVAAVESYQSLLRTPAYGLTSTTDLTGDLGNVSSEQHLMTIVVTVVVLELVLLALCVLYSTVARTAEERRAETRLARLRGFPTSSVISVGVSEPAVVMLVSFPLGILLAWAIVAAAGAGLFTGGTPVGLPPSAIGAAAAACFGAALAIGFSGWRLARADPLPDRGTLARHSRLRRDSLDLAAVVLAVAALIELSTTGVLSGGRTDPVAAVAPALVALGMAVVGMRLVPFAAAGVLRLTRRRGRLATFLAARRITRRPPLVRQMVLLSVAFSILVFASAGWVAADHNRGVYANFSIGAPQVVSVTIPRGTDFLGDVRRADPSGRQAMAVAEYQGASGTLLAVDTPRLAEVASWPSGLSSPGVQEVARMLRPATPPAITMNGGNLRTTVTYAAPPGGSASRLPPVSLVATVFDEMYQATSNVVLADLRPGTHSYVASIAGDCGTACRLVSLSPSWAPSILGDIPTGGGMPGTSFVVRVDSIAEQHGTDFVQLDAHLGDPAYWRPVSQVAGQPPAGPQVTSDGSALVLSLVPSDYVTAYNDVEPAVAAADAPSPIPVVMTSPLAAVEQGAVDSPALIQGLDGNTLTVRDVNNVPLLPGVGDSASLMDLTFALNSVSTEAVDAHYQVWETAGASPAILQRLKADGFQVTATSSGAALTSRLGHGGMALAYDLFLFAALAAVVLASGSALFAIRVSAHRTSADLAALIAVGVPRRTLRRSVILEHATVLVAGVVLGVAGGAVAVGAALSSLPELAATSGVPPLSYALPAGPVAAVVAGAAVVVAVAVLLGTALTMAGAKPEVLREDVA